MTKPPYQPTMQQMQAQAQAALQAQQQAYLQQMTQMTMYNPTSQPMGAANGRYRNTNQTTSSSSTGPAYFTYVGTGGTIHYAAAVNTSSQPAIEEAGIRAGEITGVRAWRLVGDDLLQSMYVDYIWQPGAQKITEDRVHPYGGSGFHAFKTLQQCQCNYGESNVVYGEVALWGEVYEHERGYRAECARITRIAEVWKTPVAGLKRLWENFSERDDLVLQRLRRKYGVTE